MLTKGAIGNLVNRYRAVLKKCRLINVFGSLAVASMLVLGSAGMAAGAVENEFLNTDNPSHLRQCRQKNCFVNMEHTFHSNTASRLWFQRIKQDKRFKK